MSVIPDASSDNEPYVLEIPNHGTLTGYKFRSSLTGENSTIRFAQIPYAQPLKTKNRFKHPKPIPNDFDYTGDYGKVGSRCPQASIANPIFNNPEMPFQENIQYLNISIPIGDAPEGGWPVLIYIHGGWLQYMSPNNINCDTSDLNSEFEEKYILIMVGYRLNMFGFLSSKELLEENSTNSNFGFWDQRMAIEWTDKFIHYFGGNKEKISVGGLSAGSYSTFFQLAYEIYHPEVKQIIKQVVFHSNAVCCQPKSIEETQVQFDEVITKLKLDGLSNEEKLQSLRNIPAEKLEKLIPTLDLHTFRAVSDDNFVSSSLIKDIYNGDFIKKLISKDIRILIGEVNNEPWLYSNLNTPTSKEDLLLQVENYYPTSVVKPLMGAYKSELDSLSEEDDDFPEGLKTLYGKVIADGQVYVSERGFINQLYKYGFPKDKIYRYRICFRAKFHDDIIPPECKVIHAMDSTLWNFRMVHYINEEIEVAKRWVLPYSKFLNFKDCDAIPTWKNSNYKKLNLLTSEGEIQYVDDSSWGKDVDIANTIYIAQL